MGRIESLDYLRGLMALAVAVYHFVGMSLGEPDSGDALGRLGIYAVAAFYVLSGLSLTLVYRHRLGSGPLLAAYAVKRVFRIAPLYWLVVTLAVAQAAGPAVAAGASFTIDWWRLFLNYSLLFGFVKPDAYVSTGAWSIGNEMVFYVLFPFLVALGLKSRAALAGAGLALLLVHALFAFVLLDSARPLAPQFVTYINPFNQAFLFVAGVMIGFFLDTRGPWPGGRWAVPLLAAAFAFYPARGDLVVICAGTERIVFTALTVALVAAVHAAAFRLARAPGRALGLLGEMSYSLYLLHPFVGVALVTAAHEAGMRAGAQLAALTLLAGLPVALAASYASFRLLERPMMGVGRRLAARITGADASPSAVADTGDSRNAAR
ncbi:MAG: acyltransferase [Burkholderiales bacterium]|nr:acyltransferase [Burkholderiales bacterium]